MSETANYNKGLLQQGVKLVSPTHFKSCICHLSYPIPDCQTLWPLTLTGLTPCHTRDLFTSLPSVCLGSSHIFAVQGMRLRSAPLQAGGDFHGPGWTAWLSIPPRRHGPLGALSHGGRSHLTVAVRQSGSATSSHVCQDFLRHRQRGHHGSSTSAFPHEGQCQQRAAECSGASLKGQEEPPPLREPLLQGLKSLVTWPSCCCCAAGCASFQLLPLATDHCRGLSRNLLEGAELWPASSPTASTESPV